MGQADSPNRRRLGTEYMFNLLENAHGYNGDIKQALCQRIGAAKYIPWSDMDYSHGIMDRLEAFRLERRWSKAEIARRLKLKNRQNYQHWLDRDSLPKDYWGAVAELLGDNAPAPEKYEDSVFSRLSDEAKAEVLRELLPTLSAEGKAIALELLLSHKPD